MARPRGKKSQARGPQKSHAQSTATNAPKITLSDRRCRMGDDSLEALEGLKSWQRYGLIAGKRKDIKAVEEMLHALCEGDLQ